MNEICFRSRWEYNFSAYLDLLVDRRLIANWLFEPCEFWFPVKRGNNSYKPDFMVIYFDGKVKFFEVKGYMAPKDRVKIERFRRYCSELPLTVIDRNKYEEMEKTFGNVLVNWRWPE